MQEKIKEKNHVGIDLGKRMMEVVRIKNDNKIERFRVKTDELGRMRLFNWLNKNDLVSLEAGNMSFLLAKAIKKNVGSEVIILNPGDLATIYNSLKKTDKEDALKLARLIKRIPREELPEVTIPSEKEEDSRRLYSQRSFFSNNRTCYINRLHSLFVYAGITIITKKDLKNQEVRKTLVNKLDNRYKLEGIRLLTQLEQIEDTLSEIDEEIKKVLKDNIEDVSYLMSMPGFGPINTLAFLSYIGNGSRFSHYKQVSYYAALVPRVDISGDTRYYGKIIKRGSNHIKRVIIQAAWALVKSKYGGILKKKYDDLRKRRGKKRAIIAVARKMLEFAYTLITKRSYYKYMPKEVLITKLQSYGLSM